MSLRRSILLGVIAAASIIALAFWLDKRNESRIQAEISRLVEAYDDAVILEGDFATAKELANEILNLTSEAANPQAVEVRGAIRIIFADIASGKWKRGWTRKVEKLSKLVPAEPTVARAEFLLYSGLLKGKWQHKFEEGLKQTQEAVLIAQQLNNDHALTLAHLHSSELHGFQNQANQVAMNSYRAVNVAEHLGRKSLIAKSLQSLTLNLVYLEKFPEAGEVAKRYLEFNPDSSVALYAISLADKTDRRFEQYVLNKIDEMSRRPDRETLGNQKAAIHGRMLKRLGFCYLMHKEFAKCRKFMEMAIPRLKDSNDKISLADCNDMLQLASLELADDLDELDEFAKGFDPNADFPQIVFAESLGAAYASLGEREKSLHWGKVACDLQKKDKSAEFGYLQESADAYWESEIRSRVQQEISTRIAAASNSRTWLLSMAMGLCAFLAISSFLIRRERNSLEGIVESRTESLSKAMEHANAADRAKSDFLAQINHEIRNPLSAILGYCDLLSSGNGESQQLVAGIKSSSDHLRGLVDKILEVSKIESSGVKAKNVEFFPEQTVNDINEIMAEQAAQKGLKFECVFNGDHQCAVLSDETKIRQIALNLIGNAFKFTEEGSVLVSFNLREQNDLSGDAELVISVKDSGIGIAKSETEVIFDRFTKASNGSTRVGSGLGLFIVNQLVECLNGEINLDSVLGVGTQVKVSLPLQVSKRSIAQTNSVTFRDSTIAALPLSKAGKRVLVVDDQEMIRTTVRLQLIACGLECKTTETLEDTIQLVENWQPDLVLLDLRMPKHSGFEVIEQIRQSKHFSVPVYAMTGDATLQMQQKCMELGFDGFITKPFEISSITHILQLESQAF